MLLVFVGCSSLIGSVLAIAGVWRYSRLQSGLLRLHLKPGYVAINIKTVYADDVLYPTRMELFEPRDPRDAVAWVPRCSLEEVHWNQVWFDIPWWLLLLVALGSALTLFRIRARYRPHQAQCSRCGYSLVGNLSGRCPECGLACATATS